MSDAAIPSYLEIIDFIAAGTTPQAVVDYHPSAEAQQRVAELIAREKEGGLSPEEKRNWITSWIWNISSGWPKRAPGRSRPVARDVDHTVRRLVIERARRRFEYCLAHEDSAGFPHQIDHIISRKHGGPSEIENLAYSCVLCNRYKGTDNASIDRSGRTIRFFDPRRDSWDGHFKLQGPVIQPVTAVGEVTARLLRLNAAERVMERRLMQALGQYRKG
jgi:hypothetical protein